MQNYATGPFDTKHVEMFKEFVFKTSSIVGDKPMRDLVLEASGFKSSASTADIRLSPARSRSTHKSKMKSMRQLNAAKLKELGVPWESQYLPYDSKLIRNTLVLESVIMQRINSSKMQLPPIDM